MKNGNFFIIFLILCAPRVKTVPFKEALKSVKEGSPAKAVGVVERFSGENEAVLRYLLAERFFNLGDYVGALYNFITSARVFEEFNKPTSSEVALRMAYLMAQKLPHDEIEKAIGKKAPPYFWLHLYKLTGNKYYLEKYKSTCGDLCVIPSPPAAGKAKFGLSIPLKGAQGEIGREFLLAAIMHNIEVSYGKGEITLTMKVPPICEKPTLIINSKVRLPKGCFRAIPHIKMYVRALFKYLKGKKCDFVIMYPNDAYGITSARAFEREAKKMGFKIVKKLKYKPRKSGFSSEIEALEDLSFNCVTILDTARTAGLIIPQFVFWKIKNIQFFGLNLWNSKELIDVGENFVEGVTFVDTIHPDIFGNFSKNFKDTFGFEPMNVSFLIWDVLFALMEAKMRAESTSVPLESALKACYKTPSGLVSFNDEGEILRDFFILTVKGGKIKVEKIIKSRCYEVLSEI